MSGRGGTILFGFAVTLAGLGVFLYFFVLPYREASASQGWKPTPCTIVESRLYMGRAFTFEPGVNEQDTFAYTIHVTYRYTFEGREYLGKNYDAGHRTRSSNDIEVAVLRKAVEDHPAGSLQLCYVDPADPSRAVLSRGVPSRLWGLVVESAIIVIIGLSMISSAAFGINPLGFWTAARQNRTVERSNGRTGRWP